jgi:lipoprotein LprG
VKDPKTESSDGSTTVVTGTVPRDVAASLVPGISSDVASKFVMDKSSLRLQSARFELSGAAVGITLSELDKPVKVSPPA